MLVKKLSFDEREKVGIQPIHVRDRQAMRGVLVHLELGAWNQTRGLAAGKLERGGSIAIAVDEESRHRDRAQRGPEIGFGKDMVEVEHHFQRA